MSRRSRDRRPIRWLAAIGAAMLAASACGDDSSSGESVAGSPAPDGGTVVLVTHDSFAISDDVLASFEAESGYSVDIVLAGDAGSLTNRAILTAGDPIGDLLYGIDDTFLTRALDEDVFVPYESSALDRVPDELELDAEHRVTPIDYGDVCLNYDVEHFAAGDPPPPSSITDLVDPAYRGLTVVEDAALSSPGLAFVLATVEATDDWERYWEALRANDVLVAPDWTAAYQTHFSAGGGGGDRPIVVSYATSPPADVVFAEDGRTEPLTAAVTDVCYRQIEFAGVLDGAANPRGAQALLEFMLSATFQADVPLNMFVFPARDDVALPDVFEQFAAQPERAVRIDHTEIGERRDDIIERWTEIVVE